MVYHTAKKTDYTKTKIFNSIASISGYPSMDG